MEREKVDSEVTLTFYECEGCRAIFPHTKEQMNTCPKCGKLLKKMKDQEPN
ncbi:MAG: hypothetical protein ACW98U_16595 [Candidatus Thorarchaeota archaeon]|jgi:rRNA maturation endonuclease Nob1